MSYDATAELYDAAFAWESDPGVILPLNERLGRPRRVLEVACGPARMLTTLVAEGAFGIGIDISPRMVSLAGRRLAAVRPGGFELIQGDMRDFALDVPADGAFCAVGSFGHLATVEDAQRHLAAMRTALASGAVYAIQVRLQPVRDTDARGPNEHSTWEFEFDGERLSYAWFGRGIEARTAREVQVSRIEWLTGPRAGEVVETDHDMHIWDWPSWRDLLSSGGFRQVAALDPEQGFAEVPLGEALYEHPVAWQLISAQA
ncbi:MAG TPA: class I SAM-dependent methyltransferase [Pseudomonadales bacterium]